MNDCCPLDQSIAMWQSSFFQAMKAAQVEILKEKIRQQWGDLQNKQADAIVQAMGAQWQAMLTQAKAQAELKETIQKIFRSVGK